MVVQSTGEATTKMAEQTWFRMYAGMALVTLVFQVWVRSYQCTGIQECGLSFAKAVVWSVIWIPVSMETIRLSMIDGEVTIRVIRAIPDGHGSIH